MREYRKVEIRKVRVERWCACREMVWMYTYMSIYIYIYTYTWACVSLRWLGSTCLLPSSSWKPPCHRQRTQCRNQLTSVLMDTCVRMPGRGRESDGDCTGAECRSVLSLLASLPQRAMIRAPAGDA